MRSYIKSALHQKEAKHLQKDGLDISLVIVDNVKSILNYAGANNVVYIVKKDETNTNVPKLVEIKPDKMPIGIYPQMEPFKDVYVELNKGDVIFIH